MLKRAGYDVFLLNIHLTSLGYYRTFNNAVPCGSSLISRYAFILCRLFQMPEDRIRQNKLQRWGSLFNLNHHAFKGRIGMRLDNFIRTNGIFYESQLRLCIRRNFWKILIGARRPLQLLHFHEHDHWKLVDCMIFHKWSLSIYHRIYNQAWEVFWFHSQVLKQNNWQARKQSR